MRIANVIEEGRIAGPQVRMVRVAGSLDRRVTTVIVMPKSHSKGFRDLCSEQRVSFRVLPLSRMTKDWRAALAYILFSPVEVLLLARLLRRERIDLVHASGGSWQYKAVLAAALVGKPSIWHLNDTSMPDWIRRIFRLVQPLATGFIFASYRSQIYYGNLITGQRLSAVIPSTVDCAHFDPTLKFKSDPDLPPEGENPLIGTVANVNPIKGLETLIRSAALLSERGLTPDVVIVGPIFHRQTGYHRSLVALAKDLGVKRLSFIGARRDVRPILARLDVYVCSSIAESSPVSVWEAMSMARPIVATDVGDISRHCRDGKEGFIVRSEDYVQMADRIALLLRDPSLRVRMGSAAKLASQYFSPGNIARDTYKFYRKVLKNTE